jgi:hypothetical protein
VLGAAAAAAGPIWVVCPFIKTNVLAEVLEALSPTVERLRLVTRFALRDFASGASDIAALRAAVEAGASVRGISGLHAKLYVFGQAAIVTSANLTHRGLRSNAEFGAIISDTGHVRTIVDYADDLWRSARRDVTLSQLDAWDNEVEEALRSAGQPSELISLPDHGAEVGRHGVQEGAGRVPVVNAWPAESGQAFVKFFGTGSDRLRWNVSVIDEMRVGRSYYWATYPKRPWQPQDGDTLFLARTVAGPADTRVFGRAIALPHNPDRDVADARERDLWPWVSGWPYYVRVHHVDAIDGTLGDGFSVFELTDTFGVEAFVTTHERAAGGEVGVNPRLSLRQQPAVRLMPDAASWMTARLEGLLARQGRIADADLAVLRAAEGQS